MNPENKEFIEISRPGGEDGAGDGCFDLPLLFKRDDLDIRRAAETDPALTVGEYCGLLSRFVELAQDVSEVLERFADNDFSECKIESKLLNVMVELLERMRCGKFTVDFRFLSAACLKKGDRSYAATRAEQIKEGFNGVYSRVITSKTIPAQDAPEGGMPLADYVAMLDGNGTERRLSVMAVDDSADILRAIFLVLRDSYKVYPVPEPGQVEEMLTHITPDLFLLDYSMPQITGLELITIIRGFPEHKDTPIIFLTAVGTIDRKSAAVMLGASDFLEKPIQAELLREKIAEHIAT